MSSGWKSSVATQSKLRLAVSEQQDVMWEQQRTFVNYAFRRTQPADNVLVKHGVRALRVKVLVGVLHYSVDVLAGILQQDIVASRMVRDELRDVVHLSMTRDPAVRAGFVVLDVFGSVEGQPLRHLGGADVGGIWDGGWRQKSNDLHYSCDTAGNPALVSDLGLLLGEPGHLIISADNLHL